jgi:acyl dehydratase
VKLPAGIVGASAGPITQPVDARWLMAYAAALGETAADYLDTARPGGIVGHPLFPVCYEWPLALDLRARTMPEDVALRSVHATHHRRLPRRARPGDRLTTTATVVAAEQRPPGAYLVSRFETVDADGRPVSTTDYGSIYRGVALDGAATTPAGDAPNDRRAPASPSSASSAEPAFRAAWSATVPVASGLAHVYTECARIWNPIHTDRAVALAAGLPEIILHGTATLALAVSAVLRAESLGAGAPVTGIRCRFSGMVPLSGTIEVRGRRARGGAASHQGNDPRPPASDGAIEFEVRTGDGRLAIRDGCVLLGSP